ncbi:hypothetical protein Srot_0039 [Segniliparus rotundus DSM 44985]|uniref:DUF1376 domain-containing protein n=1 Tax=Segniliparus rotundus (strain ATCC BAA-972 / CDC 1076 / CIP 108378 / DSM 44985 / JCM 13578) TaxID=640132 RepID=D6Z9K5_SEGRD|nr:hypothetical protein [Segniliparus rotundus]ADG96532.1 hypothetical protein Srot_0039 [Segniliparus rotundus DSM 44985]
MSWFKVDDGFYAHPKVMGLSDGALSLWTLAGTWCAHQLTDGVVPHAALSMHRGTPERAQELVEAGLWELHPKGHKFHDWEQYQPTKEQVEAEREAAKERMKAARAKRKAAKPVRENTEDGSRDVPENTEDGSEDVRANTDRTSGEVRLTPTRPDPSLSTDVDNSSTSPSAQCSPAELRAEFAAFWTVYPRKSGKAKAEKAFERARRKTTVEAMTEAAGRYRDDPNREAGFTKEAATWLNQECWNDPPLPPRFERTSAKPPPGPLDGYGAGVKSQIGWEMLSPTPDPQAVAMAEAAGYKPPSNGHRLREVGA